MDTRTLLRERLRRSRDWTTAIDELEKELEASGTKPEQSERLCELAALVEDVIPERDRAIGLYQRAWKLHPANVRALSRAREVYGEIGRFEMVAKLGEMELRDPNSPSDLAQIVGEAMLDSGQKEKALPILQRALEIDPGSARVQDALMALDYDPEFWTDLIDGALEKADKLDDAVAIRTLVRAARILRLEAPEDPRLEAVLKMILAKDIEEPSANFIYETLLSGSQRWDEIEAHHRQRAEKAPDHAAKVAAFRTFGLEWLQRFKDRDRGAKFFDSAIKATASNGATPMKSVVAAFTLLRQVQGDRGEWTQLLDIAESVIDRLSGEDKLYVAIQAGHIAFDKVNDIARARKFFAIASAVEPENPNVQDFVSAVGLDEPMAAGSMPEMAAAPAPVVEEPEELPASAKAKAKKKGKGGRKDADDDDEDGKAAEAAAKAKADSDVAAQADADAKAAGDAAAAKAKAAEEADAKAAGDAAAAKAKADEDAASAAAAVSAPVESPRAKAPTAQPVAEATAPGRAKSTTKAPVSGDLGEAMKAAKDAEAGADKGLAAWKDVIAKFPTNQAPRRELARILRGNQSWAQLADAL